MYKNRLLSIHIDYACSGFVILSSIDIIQNCGEDTLRKEIINIMVIVISVIAITAMAVLLFFKSGMNAALSMVLVGIPLIFAIIGVLYIISVKRRRLEDPATKVKMNELKNIAKRYLELENKVNLIKERFDIEMGETETNVLKDRLVEHGCIFTDNKVDFNANIIKTMPLINIKNVGTDLDEYTEQFYKELAKRAKLDTALLQEQFEKLEDAGYPIGEYRIQLADLAKTELGRIFDQINYYFSNMKMILNHAIDSSIDSINTTIASSSESAVDTHFIHSRTSSIKILADKGKIIDACRGLLDLNTDISRATDDEITRIRNSLQETLEITQCAKPLCEKDELKIFDEFARVLEAAIHPSDIIKLRQLDSDCRQHCTNIIERLHQKDIQLEASMRKYNPPEYFWKESNIVHKDYTITQINIIDFVHQFEYILEELAPVLEENKKCYKILSSYHNVIEKQIKKHLVESEIVMVDDLKIAHQEEFMRLYSYYHPEIFYHRGMKTLSFRNDVKTGEVEIEHPLIINITDADTRENIAAHIEIVRSSGFGTKLEYDTDADGELVIESPGDGKYILTVGAPHHKSAKIDIARPVKNIDIALQPSELIDSLCKHKEEAVRKSISRYSNAVDRSLAESGIATSSMDMRINKEYRPCFLHIYAENKPHIHFIQYNDEYLIYDENVICERVIDIARHRDTPPIAEEIRSEIGIPFDDVIKIFALIDARNELPYKLHKIS